MRGFLALLSTALLAQVSPPAKPPSGVTSSKPATTNAPARHKTAPVPAKPVTAAKNPTPVTAVTMTDEQKTIYALGLSIAQSISQFDLSPAELDLVKQA